tara:strand:- start:59 stop:529 length:471 start_codon:yes stop_codon:yes gene_type:complete
MTKTNRKRLSAVMDMRAGWEISLSLSISAKYSRISLREERRLIAKAKKGSKKEADELVLRHLGFIIYRIHKKAFPAYIERFGEDIFSETVFILYDKIKSYNLRYRDKHGNFKPVRFSSYVWKRIDGFILDSLKKEIEREKRQTVMHWERYKQSAVI